MNRTNETTLEELRDYADNNGLDLAFYDTDGGMSVCLGEEQYDCMFQRDGSIYNIDFEIYHTNIERYYNWIINLT